MVFTKYGTNSGRAQTRKCKVPKHTGNYNETKYVDLNERDIYLLNRKVYD